MEIKKGIGVSPGVVIGKAFVLDAEDLVVPRRQVEASETGGEAERLGRAIAESMVELTDLRNAVEAKHGKEIAAIFDFHIRVLKDKSLLKQILAEINKNRSSAEYALSTITRRSAQMFAEMKDKYFADRVKDIYDIEKRVLRHLLGEKREDLSHLTRDIVVIAHDMLPSQTAALDKLHVKGFATDVGGRTSHTAIVARAMSIPAVVGLGNITSEVSGGDTVIIDGTRGVVIVNPDAEQLAEHKEAGRRIDEAERVLLEQSDLPAETKDGFSFMRRNAKYSPPWTSDSNNA